MLPDLSLFFWLAIFGLICAALIFFGGLAALFWLIFFHVQFV
jgi:hypothetical protein